MTTDTNLFEDETPKRKKFIKPTIEQIAEYAIEKNIPLDAEKFFYFYESKGWVVGKAPMKNWKAAVHTWKPTNISATSVTPKKSKWAIAAEKCKK